MQRVLNEKHELENLYCSEITQKNYGHLTKQKEILKNLVGQIKIAEKVHIGFSGSYLEQFGGKLFKFKIRKSCGRYVNFKLEDILTEKSN